MKARFLGVFAVVAGVLILCLLVPGIVGNRQRWNGWPHATATVIPGLGLRVRRTRVSFSLNDRTIVAQNVGVEDTTNGRPAVGSQMIVAYEPADPTRVITENDPRSFLSAGFLVAMVFLLGGMIATVWGPRIATSLRNDK